MSKLTLPIPLGTVIITGASSGSGAEFATQLAAIGFNLFLTARRVDKLNKLATTLAADHAVKADVIQADLTLSTDIDRLEQLIAERDDIVGLINNAGYGIRGNFSTRSIESQLDMISVHILAPVRLIHAVLPQMINRRAGAIINVSSIASFFASPGGATYGATKGYLNVFSEALQGELRDTGVIVQSLCPGFFYSGFHDTAEYKNFERSQVPRSLWMSAEAVVTESLAALGKGKVIVVPGRRYKIITGAARGPFGKPMRSLGHRMSARFRRTMRPPEDA